MEGLKEVVKEMEESLTCSLCTDIFTNPRALPCQHTYCHDCLKQHIAASQKTMTIRCPLCSKQIDVPENGAAGFPIAFHQFSQLDIYLKLVNVNDHLKPQYDTHQKTRTSYLSVVCSSSNGGQTKTALGSRHVGASNVSATNFQAMGHSAKSHDKTSSLNTGRSSTPTQSSRVKFHTRPTRSEAIAKDNPVPIVTSSVIPNIFEQSLRSCILTVSKLHQYDIDFDASGIACTPQGSTVVCEDSGSMVMVYNSIGRSVRCIRMSGAIQAFDIACAQTHIYVTDSKTESVLVYDYQGNHLYTNKIRNIISGISGICTGKTSNDVYISGETSNNILTLKLSKGLGELSDQKKFVSNMLSSPKYICAGNGCFGISCQGDHCVYCVDMQGRVLYILGTPGQPGNSATQFNIPCGVAFDEQNNLFIADYTNHRIRVVSESRCMTGYIDLSFHQLKRPTGVAVDNQGNILVTCWNERSCKYCIAKFAWL